MPPPSRPLYGRLIGQIEDAAAKWQAANRAESRMWPEERILDAVCEIEVSGVSVADVENRVAVDAFLGPTDREMLEALPALTAAEDVKAGSGRYGDAWRLPLGHLARGEYGRAACAARRPPQGVGAAGGWLAGYRLAPD